jgi:hypothetical protein
LIPHLAYSLVKTSSHKGNDTGDKAFDNDNNSKWRTRGAGPNEIVIDLGASETVTGLSVKSRWSGSGKISDYTVYISDDSTNWGQGERIDLFEYPQTVTEDTAYFGAVKGRYARCTFMSNKGDLQLSEIRFYRNTCAASGKKNQPINFPTVDKKTTTDAPFQLSASSVSGNPITYSVVSGPATISGNTVTLTQAKGQVKIKASCATTATYLASERETEFTVIDVKDYPPVITTSLVDSLPVEVLDGSVWHTVYFQVDIGEKDFNSIAAVSASVDGVDHKVVSGSGFYSVSWNPKEEKAYNIELKATGNNGVSTTLARNPNVVFGSSDQTVRSLEDVVIEFGKENSRDYYGTYVFPQWVGTYKKLYAKFDVECPNGDCDDWDRWAYIDIKAPDGNWIQIIRYITPYRVGCKHEIDLTQYGSLLQGAVEMHVFIDTWGTGGWQLTLDLEYTAGKPGYIYTTVDEVWDGAFDFGNPANLESVPTATLKPHKRSEWTELYVSATGHGWGQNNTGNAAEFYHAKHDILLNGTKIYKQDLWNKCNPNPDGCSPQAGTWTYDRAGWCPGAISPPDLVTLNINPNDTAYTLDYKFQSTYVDECHPNNPNCVTGVTCADCNAGYNPHYQTDAQVVSYSNQPLVYGDVETTTGVVNYINQDEVFNLATYPNPSTGKIHVDIEQDTEEIRVSVVAIDGTQHFRYFFDSTSELEAYEFNLTALPVGVYFLQVSTAQGKGYQKLVIQ